MKILHRLVVISWCFLWLCVSAHGHSVNCHEVISFFEKCYGIPSHLLLSISEVESKRRVWAVNALGRGRYFRGRASAARFVRSLRARGISNIGVGCMQLNVRFHSGNFRCIEEMFFPINNIGYAAKLLCDLHKQHGSWERAVRFYHSSNDHYNLAYQRKVFRVWFRCNDLL